MYSVFLLVILKSSMRWWEKVIKNIFIKTQHELKHWIHITLETNSPHSLIRDINQNVTQPCVKVGYLTFHRVVKEQHLEFRLPKLIGFVSFGYLYFLKLFHAMYWVNLYFSVVRLIILLHATDPVSINNLNYVYFTELLHTFIHVRNVCIPSKKHTHNIKDNVV